MHNHGTIRHGIEHLLVHSFRFLRAAPFLLHLSFSGPKFFYRLELKFPGAGARIDRGCSAGRLFACSSSSAIASFDQFHGTGARVDRGASIASVCDAAADGLRASFPVIIGWKLVNGRVIIGILKRSREVIRVYPPSRRGRSHLIAASRKR